LNTGEFEGFLNMTNRSKEVEAGTNRKANGYNWKVTSSRSPLEVMFTSDDIVY
jgi:hypothetical protein